MKKINCILLVDDDESDNFFHTLAITDADICNQIKVVTDGRQALDYLIRSRNPDLAHEFPKPELIFLDINMPRVDGFEFLEEYEKFEEELKTGIVIFMLTTSLNPYDQERANKHSAIREFKNKPLTTEMLKGLIEKYF
ncbi:MAG: response regulator [Verrucomicrobia bacterium]|nr:response regulator [Prolixibacteraceae bacterium]